MRHGSLFSGIGGFDLAAEWMGWENKFHCEIEEFPRRVLQYYWPKAKSYADIKQTDFTIWRRHIDIVTGGFPCQPYSMAGQRKGTEDDRHLWPEMLRAIREIRPTFVVGENVYGIVNWNGGLVFDEVQADLEAEGYEVAPVILPACGKDAPHRRDRTWFVAYGNGQPFKQKTKREWRKQGKERTEMGKVNSTNGKKWDASNTNVNQRSERRLYETESEKTKRHISTPGSRPDGRNWQNFPTQPPVRGRNDGISERLDTETISEAKWRNESIKAYGNAIVPQVAYEIFKAIEVTMRDAKTREG